MRLFKIIIFIFTTMLLFSGCNCNSTIENQNNGTGNYNEGEFIMNELDINGFNTILRSPRAITEHSLSDIAKIRYDDDWDEERSNRAAINIAERTLFIYPSVHLDTLDHREPDYNMLEADVEAILSILERYDVLAWDGYYGKDYGDSEYDFIKGWELVIQFVDGTINRSWGNTSPSYAPEGYVEFYTELMEFTHSRKPNR